MHYRNGREAKNGDKIVHLNNVSGKIVSVGVLYDASVSAGSYCNGVIAPIQNPISTACLCDCLHIDDVASILENAGLGSRPEGM